MRTLIIAALLASGLFYGSGCETADPETSVIPQARPKPWENQGPAGGALGRRPGDPGNPY